MSFPLNTLERFVGVTYVATNTSFFKAGMKSNLKIIEQKLRNSNRNVENIEILLVMLDSMKNTDCFLFSSSSFFFLFCRALNKQNNITNNCEISPGIFKCTWSHRALRPIPYGHRTEK